MLFLGKSGSPDRLYFLQVKGLFVVPSSADTFDIYEGQVPEEPKKTESTFPKFR
jgi:hypothetical protein